MVVIPGLVRRLVHKRPLYYLSISFPSSMSFAAAYPPAAPPATKSGAHPETKRTQATVAANAAHPIGLDVISKNPPRRRTLPRPTARSRARPNSLFRRGAPACVRALL